MGLDCVFGGDPGCCLRQLEVRLIRGGGFEMWFTSNDKKNNMFRQYTVTWSDRLTAGPTDRLLHNCVIALQHTYLICPCHRPISHHARHRQWKGLIKNYCTNHAPNEWMLEWRLLNDNGRVKASEVAGVMDDIEIVGFAQFKTFAWLTDLHAY